MITFTFMILATHAVRIGLDYYAHLQMNLLGVMASCNYIPQIMFNVVF